MESTRLLTAGLLAAELEVPLHRVQYILSTRDHIRPRARAGTLRLYTRQTLALLRHELNAMDARKGRGRCSHNRAWAKDDEGSDHG